MGLEFSTGGLFAGMFVSTIGFGFFLFGKKQARAPQLMVGALMMVYPAFVADPWAMLAVGAMLVGGLWLALRAGA